MNFNTILSILDIKETKDVDSILDSIVMYLRKSRKDMDYFRDESIEKTLQRHEKELQEVITRTFGKPLPEKNIYREVVSGDTIEDRPVMQEVLNIIESPKIKAVICIEIERLARGNTIDQGTIAQAFQYSGTKIWTPMKIYNLDLEDDLSYFEDGLYQARKYLVYTKRILSRGRLRSIKDGKYICSTRPYGYVKKKLTNEKGYTLEICEEEARIVKMIFDFVYNDKGTSVIANTLNEMNIKPMKNDIWTPACVRNILKNPIYISKVTWNRRKTVSTLKNGTIVKSRPINNDFYLINAMHEAIIEKDIFDAVQNKMSAKNGKTIKKEFELRNPMAGLIKCGVCGRNMIRRPYMSKYQDGLMCSLAHCSNISSHLSLVENRLLGGLEELLQQYKNKAIEYEKKKVVIEDNSIRIDSLNKEIENIEKQLTRACELMEQDVYTPDMFLKRKNELESKKKETQDKIEKEKVLQKQNKKEQILNMIPKIENCLKAYPSANIEGKHQLLSSIIDSVEYIKPKGGRGYEDNFTLKIKPKL